MYPYLYPLRNFSQFEEIQVMGPSLPKKAFAQKYSMNDKSKFEKPTEKKILRHYNGCCFATTSLQLY